VVGGIKKVARNYLGIGATVDGFVTTQRLGTATQNGDKGRVMIRPRETASIGPRSGDIRLWRCDPHRNGHPSTVSVQLVGMAPGSAGLSARLSPPYSTEQAAALANAALADTLHAVQTMTTTPGQPGWATVFRGLEQALADSGRRYGPSLLIAMETPQLSPDLLAESTAALRDYDAVLGPTTGDGWWAFGLRHPGDFAMLAMMAHSMADTGSLTLATLRLGLRVAMLPTLQQVHTGADAHTVAECCPPGSRFAATVARLTPEGRPD
jgi:uncharacterized protein